VTSEQGRSLGGASGLRSGLPVPLKNPRKLLNGHLLSLLAVKHGMAIGTEHIHVIPGSIADLRKPHATTMADFGKLKDLAEKIRSAL
jgi:hypothetical protein